MDKEIEIIITPTTEIPEKKKFTEQELMELRMGGKTPKEVYLSLMETMEYLQRICYLEYFVSDDEKVLEERSNITRDIKAIFMSEKDFFLGDTMREIESICKLNGKIGEFFDVAKDFGETIYRFASNDWEVKIRETISSLTIEKIDSIRKELEEKEKWVKDLEKSSMTKIFNPDSITDAESEEW